MRVQHPRGLYLLFFTEMWERFSFYGLRALLVLYLTQVLLFSDHHAFGVYGAYMALVYATPVVGGLLADRFLGFKRAILLGGSLIVCGHACLAFSDQRVFFLGLSFIVVGTGFFKSCISSLVGQLYAKDDPRRDSGFTLFYMGINLGAFLAALTCGVVAQYLGWHYGFGLAGIGMLLGMVVFVVCQRHLGAVGMPPDSDQLVRPIGFLLSVQRLIVLGSVLCVGLISVLLQHEQAVGYLLLLTGMAALIFILFLISTSPAEDRNNLMLLLFLFFLAIIFFSLFEQAGTSLTLFTERSVDRFFYQWELPSAIFQSLNPLFIIALSPLFMRLWWWLHAANRSLTTVDQFLLGIFFAGMGFLVIVAGATFVDEHVKTHFGWVALAYLLHTMGELCISPIGLSAVTTLAPKRWVGLLMGCWFLATALSEYIGVMIARLTAIDSSAESVAHHAVYVSLFHSIGWFAVGLSVAIGAVVFLIRGRST